MSETGYSFSPSGFVDNYVQQEFKKLYLSFIYILEDLLDDGKISEDDFKRHRKRVLDAGNNAQRNAAEQLANFEIIISKRNKEQ